MPDPLDGLNDAQAQAVTHLDGPALVIGGAGTGKSEALARRFAWLAAAGPAAGRDPRAQPVAGRRRAPQEPHRGAARAAVGGAPRHDARRTSAAGSCATRRTRPAWTRSSRASAGPSAWRCCSSGSTTSPCARTRSAGTPYRCSSGFLERIDVLKSEMIAADDYVAHARGLAEATRDADDAARAHAAREAEFARPLRRPRPAPARERRPRHRRPRAARLRPAPRAPGRPPARRPSASPTCSWTTSRT